MSIFETIRSAMQGAIASVLAVKHPHQIDINYPEQHPFAGLPAGKLLLEVTDKGGLGYRHLLAPFQERPKLLDVIEPLAVRHDFTSLSSLLAYLRDHESYSKPCDISSAEAEVFVAAPDNRPALVRAFLDHTRPRLGQLSMRIDRHPVWDRFSDIFAEVKDSPIGWVALPHEMLSDLLLENSEFLVNPDVALIISRFSGVRRVTYDASLDTDRVQGLRVEWKGASTDAQGAPVPVPREIEMSIPAHVGAWEPGKEPTITARFGLRVVGREDAAPVFKLCWTNRAEYELAARLALQQGVEAMTASLWPEASRPPVYMAAPDIRRVAAPTPKT